RASASFFVQRYAPPRALPSFPTRRSSDLRLVAGAQARQVHRVGTLARHHSHRSAAIGSTLSARRAGTRIARRAIASSRSATDARSEEHTSELQSLTNLVCRLLLEKKKRQH